MLFNPFILWLLRSPFHPLVSNSIMAISYTGKKSGKTYCLPVNYIHVGDQMLTLSMTNRTWWRNFRGGAPVTLRLRGKDCSAHAEAFEDLTSVAQGLAEIVRANPKYASYLKVKIDEHGQPSLVELDYQAQKRVLVRTKMDY